MDGFHMFQEKIQAEFPREYTEFPVNCLAGKNHYADFMEMEDLEMLPQAMHFSLEYQKGHGALCMEIEDFHQIVCAMGNDIELGARKMVMYFEEA